MHLISNLAATPTTRVIRVALDDTRFDYRAGQAAAVGLDPTQATPYSIASAPFETDEQRHLEFLVKVDGSTRFGAQVSNLPPGTPLTVGAPTGGFGLPPDAPEHHLLFVAGGTGIAPIRSMLLQAIHIDKRHRPSLLYSARTPDEFAYVNEFHALQDAGKLTLILTLTGQSSAWTYSRGRAGRDHLAGLIERDTLCFVCGPPSMVADIPTACESLGVTSDRIRTERW